MSEVVEVVVGVIGRAHGLRGEVAIEVRTDEPERRFAPGTSVRFENGARTLTVESVRDHSGRTLVRFAELADRTAVEGVRGTRLVVEVPADERPEDEGEYYDRQLVGLEVRDSADAEVGTVTAVVHLPAQDALEVETRSGTRLVPFVTELVPTVDLAGGFVRLADMPGLLQDLDEGDGDR